MRFIHSLFRWFSTIILHLSLFGLIGAICFSIFLGNSTRLKNSIAESGIYDSFVPSIIEANISQQTSESSSIPLDDPKVQEIVNAVFNPRLLQTSAEHVLDGVYSWLDGSSDYLEFSIDFTEQRASLIDSLSTYSAVRLESLPPCSAQDLQTTNVFELQCRPPGFYQELVKNQVNSDLSNSDFLKNPVLTEKNLPTVKDGIPIDQKFDSAPLIYEILKSGVWIFSTVFVVATTIYIITRRPLRKGIKAFGKDMLANGFMLLVFTVFYSVILPRIMSSYTLQSNTGSNALNKSLSYFTNRLDTLIINIGIQIVAVGIVILAIERMSRSTSVYKKLAKKTGITSSIESISKSKQKSTVNGPPIQTSEAKKKTKTTKQKSSKYRKMGL